jgi:hypothetical protein
MPEEKPKREVTEEKATVVVVKPWYTSKTLWGNTLAGVALLAQAYWGFVIDAEAQAGLLVVMNLILRVITKSGLSA